MNKYLTIGISTSTKIEVEAYMNNSPFLSRRENLSEFFETRIYIEDLRDEFALMGKFLNSENLEDESPFFQQFNIDPYGLMIQFKPFNPQLELFLQPMLLLVAQEASIYLSTKCIVMFESMQIPICLFDNGHVIETFTTFNRDFFHHTIWMPKVK